MGFMILFWIAVVIAVIYLIRYLVWRPEAGRPQGQSQSYWPAPGPQTAGQGRSEAMQIVDQRYARGEIDQEEFLRRKADLMS